MRAMAVAEQDGLRNILRSSIRVRQRRPFLRPPLQPRFVVRPILCLWESGYLRYDVVGET
jgi:hypothetical protein